MKSNLRLLPLSLLVSLLICPPARSLTLTWTNSAGGSWDTAANWLPNLVPGPSDIAIITLQGNYTVIAGGDISVGGLTLGGGTLQVNGGLSSSNAIVSGGTLTGGGSGVIAGAWTWASGSFGPGGTLTLATNGTLTVSLAGNNTLVAQGSLINQGTIQLSGDGTLLLNGVSGGGQLVSRAGASITASGKAQISQQGYGSELFVNAGVLSAQSGTLTLNTPRGNGSGQFVAAAGATLDFNNDFSLTNGAVLNGAGTNVFGHGTITLAGGVTSSNAVMAGASLTGANGFMIGAWNWVGGSLYGTLTLTANGVLTVATSTNTLVLYGSLTDIGTIDLQGSGTLLLNGVTGLGQLINASSGSVNGQGTVAISHQGYSSETLNNSGTVTAQNGMLTIASTGGGSGQFTAGSGATLNFASDYAISSGGVAGGDGTVLLSGGRITLNGSLNAPNAVLGGAVLLGAGGTINGSLNWTNGSIGAGASLTIAPGGTLTVAPSGQSLVLNGALTNSGTLQLTGSGTLLLNGVSGGGELINTSSGSISGQGSVAIVEQGYGSELFVNAGALTAGSGTLTLNTKLGSGGGQFTANGGATLNIANDYRVTAGAVLSGAGTNVLSAGTITLSGNVTLSNAVLAGASLAGTNGLITGTLVWTGGNIAAGSTLTVATNALVKVMLAGKDSLQINGMLTNQGTIQIADNGTLLLDGVSGGGVLINTASGAINAQGSVGIAEQGYGSELFVNSGVVTDQSGALVVNAKQGIGGGRFMANAGGTVNFTDSFTLTNGAVLAGGGSNVLSGGTITLAGGVISSNAVLDGAILSGTNGVLLGTWVWASGNIGAGGRLTVPTNGVLTVAPGGGTVTLSGSLTNSGNLDLQGAGVLLLNGVQGGGELINAAGASLTSRGTVGITQQGYGSEAFVNSGSVVAQNGKLTLKTAAGSGGGQFLADSGATLEFDNGFTLTDGASIGGGGTTQLSGGDIALNGGVTLMNTVLAGATLSGANGSIHGTLLWTNGAIVAGSTLTVAADALVTVAVQGNDSLTLGGSVTNTGMIQLQGNGTLLLNGVSGGGQLINAGGGRINSQGNVTIAEQGYGSELFVNAGVLAAQNGTLTLNTPRGTSTGQFNAGSGTTLNFAGGFYLGNGTVLAGAGTNLLSSGTISLQGSVTSSNAVLAGATLAGTNGVLAGLWDWTSGTIGGGSTLTVGTNGQLSAELAANDTLILYGVLTNAGVFEVEGTGTLELNGVQGQGELVNLAGGEIEAQGNVSIEHQGFGSELIVNAGAFVNVSGSNTTAVTVPFVNTGVVYAESGTVSFQGAYSETNGELEFGLNGLNNYGRISFAGNAALGGTLDVVLNGGFLPVVGNQFTLMTYGSASGSFGATNFPAGLAWVTVADTNHTVVSVVAVVPAIPKIITQPLSQTTTAGADVTFTVGATGSAPLNYQWEFKGVALASATNSILTVTNAQLIQAGPYSVVVSNSLGVAVSSNAVLTLVNPAAPTMTDPSYSAGAFSFSFATQLGVSYEVEYKNALTESIWTNLQLIAGTGAVVKVSDPSAAGHARYYRLRVL